MRGLRSFVGKLVIVAALVGCGEVSYVQKESPSNVYKDYRAENQASAAVVGVGDPITKRQMKANATFRLTGTHDLEGVMHKVAGVYNVAVRWGNGVRRNQRNTLLIADLTFDEARAYIEDVYSVQIIREGERRLLVLPSANEARVTEFAPGVRISLAQTLRGLADQCDYNLVINESKDKIANTYVTTNLKDVSCYDAFSAVLNPHGLSLTNEGDYFAVRGLPQRQWTLNLQEDPRTEETTVTYSSEFEGDSESGGSQTAGGESTVTVTSERRLWDELESDLISLLDSSCSIEANAVASGSDSVLLPPQSLDTPDGGAGDAESSDNPTVPSQCGYVRVNPTVGLVQMRAPSDVLVEADEIVRRIEDIASRRLLLEARVLAVTRTRNFDQGANTQFAFDNNDNQFNVGFQPSVTSVAATLAGRLASISQNGGFLSAQGQDLSAVVRLVEQFGTTYELMQPTIELMDRQKATLIDGRNERFFISTLETETLEGGGVLRNLTKEERVQFVGLQFSASAQVAQEGEPHTITLQIPITSIARTVQLAQTFDNEDVVDEIPIATTRLIDQKVRVRDGEIKVIGGLTKTVAIDNESGVPLLREIPSFGKLLNEENITFEEVEFIVLLQVKRLY